MASTARQVNVGDCVIYEGKLCICVDKDLTSLGWNNYVVRDMVDGRHYTTNKHKLFHIDFMTEIPEEVVDMEPEAEPTFNTGNELQTNNVPAINVLDQGKGNVTNVVSTTDTNTTCTAPAQGQMPRHEALSDRELDEMADERLSEHTKQQTRWAVKVFRGEKIMIGKLLILNSPAFYVKIKLQILCLQKYS